jgi:hypothetical protein
MYCRMVPIRGRTVASVFGLLMTQMLMLMTMTPNRHTAFVRFVDEHVVAGATDENLHPLRKIFSKTAGAFHATVDSYDRR